jgi:hypothetical protein
MDDLKAMKTTFKSSMDSQMITMREYIAELLAQKAPHVKPIQEDTYPLLAGRASGSSASKSPVDHQDGDPNDQVYQVIPPRTSRSKEEIEARRLARRKEIWKFLNKHMIRFLVM